MKAEAGIGMEPFPITQSTTDSAILIDCRIKSTPSVSPIGSIIERDAFLSAGRTTNFSDTTFLSYLI